MNKRILVADVPELDTRLVEMLAGHRLYFVRALDEAVRALQHEDFHLLIVSVHFDDSRMFDLLRRVRVDGRNRNIPVVCVRKPGMSSTSAHALELTCRALEANVFIDLAALKEEEERRAALAGALAPLLKGG